MIAIMYIIVVLIFIAWLVVLMDQKSINFNQKLEKLSYGHVVWIICCAICIISASIAILSLLPLSIFLYYEEWKYKIRHPQTAQIT